MLETHYTKNGDSCLIAQMSDEHLGRMIRLILKAVNETKTKSEGAVLDPYQMALYGLKRIDAESAAAANREAIRKLYPYLAEAYLRGLNDVRNDLVASIGRDIALPGGLPALPFVAAGRIASSVWDENDPFDDDDIRF